jgi:hypothetical protein
MAFSGPIVNGYGPGQTFSPPINAQRQAIAAMDGWSQQIKLENVPPDNLGTTTAQPLGSTDLVRVTVTINYKGPNDSAASTITSVSWVIGQ